MTTLLVYYDFFFFLVALDLILYHIVIKSCVAKSRNLCIWSRNEFLCVFYLEQEWQQYKTGILNKFAMHRDKQDA